jgi:hypothetical protein
VLGYGSFKSLFPFFLMMETGTVSKRLAYHKQNQVIDIVKTCQFKDTAPKNLKIQSYRSKEEISCAIRHINRAAKIEESVQ